MAYSLKEINDAVRSDPKGFAEECDAGFAKKVEKCGTACIPLLFIEEPESHMLPLHHGTVRLRR